MMTMETGFYSIIHNNHKL